jgi:adenosine deaminase
MDAVDAIRSLPKAELHQHLDGSMRPETALELAREVGLGLDLAEARRRMVGPERCADQAELLTFFDLPISLLQTPAALRRVTGELIDDLAADGIRYAEIRWAPRLHLQAGLSVTDVIEAVATGVAARAATLGPSMPLVGLIVTAMRSHPPAANVELASAAAAFGHPVIGFDLAGPEAAYPAPPHALAFETAATGGLALTAHAGEVRGAGRIREVMEFGVRRIAHGVTAAEDAGLLERIRAADITLDLCPSSNVQAGIVESVRAHPLADLHRAGVSVTVSTDDRTVTGTGLTDELWRCATAMQLTRAELAAIAVNAFRRGFAPDALRAPLLGEADLAWNAWAGASAIS